MASVGVGRRPSRKTGLVSLTILCPSCGEKPARGCRQAGEQTLTTGSLGKGRNGAGVRAGCGRRDMLGTPRLAAQSRLHGRPRPDSWAPPGGRGERKPAETADTAALCKYLEGSRDPAQLLFTAFGENGSYVFCLQLGRWGDAAAALLGAAVSRHRAGWRNRGHERWSKWADSGRLREGMRRRVPSEAHVLKSRGHCGRGQGLAPKASPAGAPAPSLGRCRTGCEQTGHAPDGAEGSREPPLILTHD